jgi:hypothetical protein
MATRTVTIKPGEKVILPLDAQITGLVIDGAISVSSTCNNLPVPSAYKCGYFIYVRDDEGGAGPFDEGVSIIATIKVGETTFTINEDATNPSAAALNSHITDQALFEVMHVDTTTNDFSERKYIVVYFKTPEQVFDTLEMVLDERNNGFILYTVKPVEYDCETYDVAV